MQKMQTLGMLSQLGRLPDFTNLTLLLATIALVVGCGGGGGGSGSTPANSGWLIPVGEVIDGGPGRDGIPAIDNPIFVPLDQGVVLEGDLVIGIMADGEPRAIPHNIMNWHEIVNDTVQAGPIVMSYCPLTGSALLWESTASDPNPTFGVSGLLYNSNLILFDRETESNWSQMRIQAVEGQRRGEVPQILPLVEMRIERWRAMYPDSVILSRQTGFSRDYNRYPYGSFRTNTDLLFPVNPRDTRLHEKTRVIGVEMNGLARAYVIDDFEPFLEVINDTINGVPIVVTGSSDGRFGVIFERTLTDGTLLMFSAVTEPGPSVMTDDEGNAWDLFGEALTGPRAGQRLVLTRSHIAYWFAWGAFHPDSEIYSQ